MSEMSMSLSWFMLRFSSTRLSNEGVLFAEPGRIMFLSCSVTLPRYMKGRDWLPLP